MSDGTDLKQVVTDEVSEQLEVDDLLGDGTIRDAIDGDELGAAVGRTFGEQVGRAFGAAIGRKIHLAIADAVEQEKDRQELQSDLTTAVRDAVSETVQGAAVSDSVRSLLGEATGEGDLADLLEDEDEETEDDEETTEDEDTGGDADEDDEAERDSESEGDDESADEQTEDDAETEPDDAEAEMDAQDESGDAEDGDESTEDDSSGPSAGNLEELRTETLEDFLGVMSYEELQSIAKDVDVKANLSREEMTAEIIETVSDEADEPSGDADAGDGDDSNEDGDETDTESEAEAEAS